jgi:hypothetical protein
VGARATDGGAGKALSIADAELTHSGMGDGILASLDIGGQIAFFVATAAGVAYVYVWILWRPRHLSHRRDHDCHSLGCPWLKERPR